MQRRADYADFFTPCLASDALVLDCGCGIGTITVGLADALPDGAVVGVDLDPGGFAAARGYAAERELRVDFAEADLTRLPFGSNRFDAALCHSALETLPDPEAGLREIQRVLKPGGWVGVASVEYGGRVLCGPDVELLDHFYRAREQLWLRERLADPWQGRRLRGLLESTGYVEVRAFVHTFSHGTAAAPPVEDSQRSAH